MIMIKQFNCGYQLELKLINIYYKPYVINQLEIKAIPLIIFENELDKCNRFLTDLDNNLNQWIPFNSFYLMVSGAIASALKYAL